MHEKQVAARFKVKEIDRWLRQRFLQKLPTRIGQAFILGPKGREHFGLSRSPSLSPDRTLDHIVQRCVLEALHAFHVATFISDNVMVIRREQTTFVAAKWSPYRSRSVKELLRKHKLELLRQRATLVIVTSKPYTLGNLAHHDLLELWNLKDICTWQDLVGSNAL
jgi:hypothetical protein